MPRQQNPALNWKCFQLFTICASKTKKGLKWIRNILTDVQKAEPVQGVCSHWSPCASAPDTEGPQWWFNWWFNCTHALKPSQQSCTPWTSQPGCALVAEGLPGQRGGAERRTDSLSTRILFPTCWLDCEPSPAQTRGRWIVQITQPVLLIYNSTASDKEKNLKCSAPFKQEESPWWQAGECVACFSTTPRCTHTPHGARDAPEVCTQAHCACKRVKPPAPPPRARSTKHEKQNLSGTSLLQIVVISHLSSAWMTLPGPQGTISSIRFGLRVPWLWLRRQSKWPAAASHGHGEWSKCQSQGPC